MNFPLASSSPSALGFAPEPLDRLATMIEGHIRAGRYPGAQIALARRGKLALVKTFGDAAIEPSRLPAADDTLWLLYSNTKVITACAVWLLVERGLLRFTDTIAQHVPGFEANGKGDITLVQVLTHQGGFPNADVPREAWEDHELLRRVVSNFTLEFTPGTRMHYHGRAAHWTAAVLIEALTKQDYRTFIRDNVVGPLGLAGELFVGLPEVEGKRAADMHEPSADGGEDRQARRGEQRRLPQGRHPGRRRLRHRARDGGLLPDDGGRRHAQRRAPALAAHGRSTSRATSPATWSTTTWACRCTAASAPTRAAPRRPSVVSARWPRRARSATAASARPTAGPIRTPACRSPT